MTSVREVIRRKHPSLSTERSYCYYIYSFRDYRKLDKTLAEIRGTKLLLGDFIKQVLLEKIDRNIKLIGKEI